MHLKIEYLRLKYILKALLFVYFLKIYLYKYILIIVLFLVIPFFPQFISQKL